MSQPKPNLTQLALAAVAHCVGHASPTTPEAEFLAEHGRLVLSGTLSTAVEHALKNPARQDEPLCALAEAAGLRPCEVLAIALAANVEQSTIIGRAVALAQAPLGGSRPTLGLLAECFGRLEQPHATPLQFATGAAAQAGVLTLLNEEAPLPERAVAVPASLCLALNGTETCWPGGMIQPGGVAGTLTESIRAACHNHAKALAMPDSPVLVIRATHAEESRAVATEISRALKLRPFFAESSPVSGLGAWLLLRQLLPVFVMEAAPGETKLVPTVPLHQGPTLVITGPDGSVEAPGRETINWSLPMPSREERKRLWREIIHDQNAADELASSHRQTAARIAQLGRLARHRARLHGRTLPDAEFVRAVSRSGEGSGLSSLAQPMLDSVGETALVLSLETRTELEALVARCRHRDGLADGLGASAGARYTPGVRALFTGPSGTGKTLAACWLATRLGLPLFRVDLSAITSKYIGETEKNLARLLARAEGTEAVLLFDEADSLFGKRTDVRDSNDRFANAQTNYLLQRIETFDGIALLTSNSRARFDTAFSRRLDLVIEFPLPGPAERHELWVAHLGGEHALKPQELNLLASQCDFTGGQIRNVVLGAAVEARHKLSPIDLPKVLRALTPEYRKLGRLLPPALAGARNGNGK